jgi:hypothetical protein
MFDPTALAGSGSTMSTPGMSSPAGC